MKTTSEKFKVKAESSTGARYYLRILANGTEITDDIDNFYYSNIVNADSYFSIGNTASAMVTFSINSPSQNLEDLELKISQGIDVDGTIEYVDLGIFKVLKPTDERNVYQYQCVDRMTYLMNTDHVSTLSLPTTDIAMLKDICSQVGITLVENGLISHSINFIPSGYTKREIIGYMAQLQGKNAVINSDGNLELVGYSATDFVVDDNKIYYDGTSEVTSETNFVVEYVSCTVYDEENVTELVSGSGDMGIVLENPFMTQAILNEVYNKLKGFSFGIGEFEFLGDFRLEVGDIVTVETNGNTYTIPIMQIEHKSDGGVVTTITSIGQTTTEDGINSTSPTDRLIRRLNLQIRDSRKLIGENYERIIEQGTEIEVVQGKIENKIWQEDIINNYTTGSKEGNPILLTDSADSNLIDFSAYGKSEQDGTPTPDNPMEIVSVGDKGFFDGELLQGYYNSSTGVYASNNPNAVCSKNAIPCSEGDSITVTYPDTVSQIRITYYNNGAYATFNVANNVSEYTFTVPTNATEFHISVIANSETTPTNAKHICVTINGMYALIVKNGNKNLLENTYVPHESKTTYIPLTEPLRGIGEVKDEIACVDGVYGVIRRFANIVFNGSESWSIDNVNRKRIALENLYYLLNTKSAMCTHYSYAQTNRANTFFAYSTGDMYFVDDTSTRTTLTEWKNWLVENNMAVNYRLATPVFTPFADQTPFYSMKTFDGVTLISSDAEMEIAYYRNTEDGKRIGGGYSLISQRIDDIVLEVSDLSNDISAKLELKIDKNDNDQIVSMINASADEINLKSNRFSLESDYTSITKDGVFTTVSGTIGGWGISKTDISRVFEEEVAGDIIKYKTVLNNYLELSGTYPQYLDGSVEEITSNASIKLILDGKIYQSQNNPLTWYPGLHIASDNDIFMYSNYGGIYFMEDNNTVMSIANKVVTVNDVKTVDGVSLQQCLRVLGTHSINVNFASTEASGRAAKTVVELGKSYPNASFFVITHSANSDWVVLHPVGWNNTEKSSVIINYQNFYTSQITGAVNVIVVGTS